MSEIDKLAPSGTPRIVIGNKSDLELKRVISTKEGREAAMKFKAQFFETSAKTSINVEDAFKAMTQEMIEKMEKQTVSTTPSKPTKGAGKLIQGDKKTKSAIGAGGCC